VKVELLGFWFCLVHVARHEISEKFFSRCGGAQVKLNVEVTFASPSRSFQSNLCPRCFVPSLKFHSLLQIENPTHDEQQSRKVNFKQTSDGLHIFPHRLIDLFR
jgi:hypothetical protein